MTDSVIRIRSGTLDLLDPDPDDIELEDIAHALSNLCRFTGHSRTFYSVAQHSVLVSKLVPEEHALAGLMHDAEEAYFGDMSSPLKRILDSPTFVAAVDLIKSRIAEKFDYEYPFSKYVKEADIDAIIFERRDLTSESMPYWQSYWSETVVPKIIGMPPEWCELNFLKRFEEVK